MSEKGVIASSSENDLSSWLELTKQLAQQLDDRTSVVENYWKHGTREDGRAFTEMRNYKIQHGILQTAAGSAMCQAGSSLVLTSITLQVGQPSAMAPKQGDISVNIEDGSASLQSFLQRIMDETMDLEQLCISQGKLAYRLVATISILNDGGSLTSVCLASLVASLFDTRLPDPKIVEGVVHEDETAESKKLTLPVVPCAVSAAGVCLLEEFQWIMDPVGAEEAIQDTSMLVVVDAKTLEVLIVDIAPSLHIAVRPKAVSVMIECAQNHSKDLVASLAHIKR